MKLEIYAVHDSAVGAFNRPCFSARVVRRSGALRVRSMIRRMVFLRMRLTIRFFRSVCMMMFRRWLRLFRRNVFVAR